MYRKNLQERKMVAEMEQAQAHPAMDLQVVKRVGNLPVVSMAVGQLMTLYNTTKEKNSLVKYTLETAESGVKLVADSTRPVVEKFEKPIGSLDTYACSQLDKLEKTYPSITKPTNELADDTKQLYDRTLKPTVDKVTAVKQYGVDTYVAAKDYSTGKVNDVKTYTCNKIDGVKQYGTDTLTGAYSYGSQKLNAALKTPYGQVVAAKLDQVLDVTEKYVEEYLPEGNEEAQTDGGKAGEKMEVDEVHIAGDPLTRTVTLTSKVRRRMYTRAMNDLQNLQRRSQDTLKKLHYTVDLIQYAKTNIDNRVSDTKEKLTYIWEEVNKTEEEVEAEEVAAAQEEKMGVERQVSTVTFEKRAIVTARHLTLKLKRSLNTINSTLTVLPTTLRTKFSEAGKYTNDFYNSFATAEKFEDLSQQMLAQFQDKLAYLTEAVSFAFDYVMSKDPLKWLGYGKKTTDQTGEVAVENTESGTQADQSELQKLVGVKRKRDDAEEEASEVSQEISAESEDLDDSRLEGDSSVEAEDSMNITDSYEKSVSDPELEA